MNLHKTITRYATAPDDPRELKRVARALGHELPRQRSTTLRGFRAEMSRVRGVAPQNDCHASYAAGYVACMLDITAEFEVALGDLEDALELQREALAESWREVLALLEDGAMLPSVIAERMSVDRSSVSRLLHKMRAAGVVDTAPGDTLDGRARPHRITQNGRRLLARVGGGLSRDMLRGIQVAVALIGQMQGRDADRDEGLRGVARTILGDAEVAEHAIEACLAATAEHGVRCHPVRAVGDHDGSAQDDAHHEASAPEVASDEPWQRVPRVLASVAPSDGAVADKPLYIRTTDESWPAWAYALTQDQSHQRSRTIVDGDLLTRCIQPPDRPYRLVYDHPSAIASDAEDPGMRELVARADEKFVVAYGEEEPGSVPDGFIVIPMSASAEERG